MGDSAHAREKVKIGSKMVALSSITLSSDFYFKESPMTADLYYTFYLDQLDLKIADAYRDQYLNSGSTYKVMAAIILLYTEEEFKKYPCLGKNKCVKNIKLGVKGFFAYLNQRPELRTKFLEAWSSQSLFAPKYKCLDELFLWVAKDVGYSLYAISYMKVDSPFTRTLLDKMVYAMRNN